LLRDQADRNQYMNQSGLLRWLAPLAIILTISGCGGGNSSGAGIATTVTLTPAALSLDFGQVSSISVTVTDSSGNIVSTPTTSFSSDNTAVATVSTGGLICAGTWDSLTNPVVCTATKTAGTAHITAVAAGITSSATVVTTHPRIASLTISAPTTPCVSDATTAQFTATGKDSSGNTIPLIGTPTWTSISPAVSTIDANGLATAKLPGVTTVFATLNGVSSLPVNFTTCPPASITLSTPDATSPNAATLAPAATVQLTATATDILGNAMPDLPAVLTYSSSQPTTATVGTAGLVTAIAPGNAGIVASCVTGCISGLPQVYSNLVATNVTGSSATTVYATGANATSIIPIDSTTNAVGAAITIPQISGVQPVINSFVFNKAGTKAYLGSDKGMLILDPTVTPNTFAAPVGLGGKVLAVSADGVKVVIANASNVFVYDTGKGTSDTLAIAGATAADFASDNSRGFIVAGNNLYVYPPASPLTVRALAAPATDITVLSQGSAAYLAGGSASPGINVRATCDFTSISDVPVTPAPALIKSSFDSKHVLAVDTTSIDDIAVTTNSAPCPSTVPAPATPPPPLVSNSLTHRVAFPGAAFTPNQLIVTNDATQAFVTNNGSTLLQYSSAPGTTSAIPLLGGATATTTGGLTFDSKNLYVGALGTNDVQRIDIPSDVDVQQIPINLGTTPDFVVVRPK
jgi:trimeric autotransporter adhesin